MNGYEWYRIASQSMVPHIERSGDNSAREPSVLDLTIEVGENPIGYRNLTRSPYAKGSSLIDGLNGTSQISIDSSVTPDCKPQSQV